MKNLYLLKPVKAFIIVCLPLCFYHSPALAQAAITASGGDASGSGGSASYSVGQVFFNEHEGISGSIMEGVQQPYEISVATNLEEAGRIDLVFSVYPNPFTEYLILRMDESLLQSRHVASLYDIQGKLLMKKEITSGETSIPMNEFSPGTYFLKIIEIRQLLSLKEVKTFKVIKN